LERQNGRVGLTVPLLNCPAAGLGLGLNGMKRSRLVAVENVEIEVPHGLDEEILRFYVEIGHLDSVFSEKDGDLKGFRSASLELRLCRVDRPAIDPVRRRLTLLVPSVREAVEKLDEIGLTWVPISGFSFTDRRIATFDPAGHRVELKQEWPEAPL
jgi:hypothetical protein